MKVFTGGQNTFVEGGWRDFRSYWIARLPVRVLVVGWLLFAYAGGLQARGPDTIVNDDDPAGASAVRGIVLDATGAAIQDALITLAAADSKQNGQGKAVTDASGNFSIERLKPGAYILTINAPQFAVRTLEAVTIAGQTKDLGQITLTVAVAKSTVQVTPSRQMEADAQLAVEERQRLLGIVPNFLVTYEPDPAPLSVKQKFQLTFKLVSDPTSFGITGIIAGIEQAADGFHGYGQGAAGFGRRYGAAYGDFFIGNLLGSAVLPSLFKQDPRYFVKGEGSIKSRLLYALANSVVRRGDNRRWQPDYSGILGNLAAGGISNAYYPASNRSGASVTFENAGIGLGATAAANVLQEFIFRKITPKVHARQPKTGP